MTKALKKQGKTTACLLIENQYERGSAVVLVAASIAGDPPRGGVAAADLLPLCPTPFSILGKPEGGR